MPKTNITAAQAAFREGKNDMKIAILYRSHYGSTETYAKWLAEDLNADLYQASRIKPSELERYDTIVYGGGLYAGGINGISLLTKHQDSFKGKTLYLFTVGASDATNPENIKAIRNALQQKVPPALFEKAHVYHLRGGMHYSKMSFLHRMLMGMMIKMLRKKPENELSREDKQLLDSVNQDADFTDRKALAPLVADLRAGATKT